MAGRAAGPGGRCCREQRRRTPDADDRQDIQQQRIDDPIDDTEPENVPDQVSTMRARRWVHPLDGGARLLLTGTRNVNGVNALTKQENNI